VLSDGFRWCRVPGGRRTAVPVGPAVTRPARQLPIPGGGHLVPVMCARARRSAAHGALAQALRALPAPAARRRLWRSRLTGPPGQYARGDSGGCEGPAEKAGEGNRGGSVGDHGTSAFLNSPGGYGPGTGQPAVVLRRLEALRLGTPGHSPRQAKTESSRRQYVRSPLLTSDISSGKCVGHYDRHARWASLLARCTLHPGDSAAVVADRLLPRRRRTPVTGGLGWRPPGSLSTATAPWPPAGTWRRPRGHLRGRGRDRAATFVRAL
jgi:hypothetical protein